MDCIKINHLINDYRFFDFIADYLISLRLIFMINAIHLAFFLVFDKVFFSFFIAISYMLILFICEIFLHNLYDKNNIHLY